MKRRLPCVAALLLAACAKDEGLPSPAPAPAATADAAASSPDAAPSPRADAASVPPDAAPCPPPPPPATDAAIARPAEYPPGPYNIFHCDTVGPTTFKKRDDTPLSLADIRAMPSVAVIVIVEASTGQEPYVQRLNPVHDELAPMGLYTLAVLVDRDATGEKLAAWEGKTQSKGVSVYGNRITGLGGITSGYPSVYVIHASSMKIQTQIRGFAFVTTEAVRAAARAALATAPP